MVYKYGRYGKFDVCSPHNFNYQVFEKQMINVLREIFKEYKDKRKGNSFYRSERKYL